MGRSENSYRDRELGQVFYFENSNHTCNAVILNFTFSEIFPVAYRTKNDESITISVPNILPVNYR